MWRLNLDALSDAAAKLAHRAQEIGGTLIVVNSPRTPAIAREVVSEVTAGNVNVAFADTTIRYAVLLNAADEQFVTADSVSMISEAVMTGRPVGLIAVEPDARGRRRLGLDPAKTKIRDPRRFWADVEARGLAGTVEKPALGDCEDPVDIAVAAVRRAMPELFD
jgi:hypothetical protein